MYPIYWMGECVEYILTHTPCPPPPSTHTQTHTDTHRHTQTHTDTHTDTHPHTHTQTHTHIPSHIPGLMAVSGGLLSRIVSCRSWSSASCWSLLCSCVAD